MIVTGHPGTRRDGHAQHGHTGPGAVEQHFDLRAARPRAVPLTVAHHHSTHLHHRPFELLF
ncbi:MAG TPA: hypothetical protein VHB02_18890 [Acidimicrobiales bacterium]|nr:hypothetical protein [Acidimicrobiales bacterium]